MNFVNRILMANSIICLHFVHQQFVNWRANLIKTKCQRTIHLSIHCLCVNSFNFTEIKIFNFIVGIGMELIEFVTNFM